MMKKVITVSAVLVIAAVAFLYFSYNGAIARFPINEKIVVLTYDDGPNPPYTQALLEVLARHQIKATFFPKARNVEAYPEVLRLVAEAGHEIGNHSYYHQAMLSFDSAAMRAELERSNDIIAAVAGESPVFFRPPYGAQGIGVRRAVDELGMTSILMSVNGTDWELSDPQQIASEILENIAPGNIILLHDGHGDVDDPGAQNSRAASVAATEIIIEALQAEGYSFATVGELMASTWPQ